MLESVDKDFQGHGGGAGFRDDGLEDDVVVGLLQLLVRHSLDLGQAREANEVQRLALAHRQLVVDHLRVHEEVVAPVEVFVGEDALPALVGVGGCPVEVPLFEHLQGFPHDLHLDEPVDLRRLLQQTLVPLLLQVYVQRRVVVDLEEPGLELFVDEDVEAQDLEAVALRLCHVYLVFLVLEHKWLNSNQSLGARFLDLLPEELGVDVLLLEQSHHRGESPLGAVLLLVQVSAVDVVLALLVQGVVGQVAQDLVHVLPRRFLVILRAEPHQGFVCNVGDNWVHGENQHVDS